MTSDDSVSVTTVFTSPSLHLYTGAKRTFVMEWSSFKTTYHDPTKLGTSIDEEYKTEQIRVEETATCTESLGLDLEPVLDHRTSVLHTNLDVLKQNVQNVDKVWLLLQSVKTLVHDSFYNRFCAVTRLSYEQTDDIKSSRFKIFCDRLTRPDRARHTVCWCRMQRNRPPCRANGAATQQAPHPARVRRRSRPFRPRGQEP